MRVGALPVLIATVSRVKSCFVERLLLRSAFNETSHHLRCRVELPAALLKNFKGRVGPGGGEGERGRRHHLRALARDFLSTGVGASERIAPPAPMAAASRVDFCRVELPSACAGALMSS